MPTIGRKLLGQDIHMRRSKPITQMIYLLLGDIIALRESSL